MRLAGGRMDSDSSFPRLTVIGCPPVPGSIPGSGERFPHPDESTCGSRLGELLKEEGFMLRCDIWRNTILALCLVSAPGLALGDDDAKQAAPKPDDKSSEKPEIAWAKSYSDALATAQERQADHD